MVDGTSGPTPPPETYKETTLNTILQAIAASREALELKIDTMVTDLGLLRDGICHLAETVATTERTLEDISTEMTTIRERMSTLEDT
ncbi:hypothetical protein NDU88_003294 [Pleurodeles waltl]|uniref:Uncharacterized protein n=1 Tax=Pleurodeles waltl TaxID=8319 RepID=A0AAV7KYJ2_PLEWA|nr:hypothetical protein NDU88_003294 [Pleurodeles waltl]